MELTPPWPTSTGEALAFASAVCAILAGLAALVLPDLWTRLTGEPRHRAAPASLRAASGFPIGLGLAAIMLAQPFVYIALGAGWLFTALGRAISMLADRGNILARGAWLLIELVLAALPLAYVFGFVP